MAVPNFDHLKVKHKPENHTLKNLSPSNVIKWHDEMTAIFTLQEDTRTLVELVCDKVGHPLIEEHIIKSRSEFDSDDWKLATGQAHESTQES